MITPFLIQHRQVPTSAILTFDRQVEALSIRDLQTDKQQLLHQKEIIARIVAASYNQKYFPIYTKNNTDIV